MCEIIIVARVTRTIIYQGMSTFAFGWDDGRLLQEGRRKAFCGVMMMTLTTPHNATQEGRERGGSRIK
jgi:hypothetical protein